MITFTISKLILIVIAAVLAIVCFMIGYRSGNDKDDYFIKENSKLDYLKTFVEPFIRLADEYLKGASGHEKMGAVVERLSSLAKRLNIDITDKEIGAIVQLEYDAYKIGRDLAEQTQVTYVIENEGEPYEPIEELEEPGTFYLFTKTEDDRSLAEETTEESDVDNEPSKLEEVEKKPSPLGYAFNW